MYCAATFSDFRRWLCRDATLCVFELFVANTFVRSFNLPMALKILENYLQGFQAYHDKQYTRLSILP